MFCMVTWRVRLAIVLAHFMFILENKNSISENRDNTATITLKVYTFLNQDFIMGRVTF